MLHAKYHDHLTSASRKEDFKGFLPCHHLSHVTCEPSGQYYKQFLLVSDLDNSKEQHGFMEQGQNRGSNISMLLVERKI